ncbi:MAG: hypothetical protein PUJ59_07070, partial [Clostridiaceae bacterium]|nr:hypothetical protein [Clostridiaceae bacterium]MDY5889277.1 hypothetical protein [Oscillospiraceae bacterium]
YTIVIYGDVNGDGQINIADSSTLALAIQKDIALSSAAQKAAKLVSRSGLALVDYNALVNVIQKKSTINQVTGKLS